MNVNALDEKAGESVNVDVGLTWTVCVSQF